MSRFCSQILYPTRGEVFLSTFVCVWCGHDTKEEVDCKNRLDLIWFYFFMAPSKLCNEIRQVPSLPLSPSYKRNNNWTELDRTGESKIFFKNKARLLFVLIYQGNIRDCYCDDLLQTLPYPPPPKKVGISFLFPTNKKNNNKRKKSTSLTHWYVAGACFHRKLDALLLLSSNATPLFSSLHTNPQQSHFESHIYITSSSGLNCFEPSTTTNHHQPPPPKGNLARPPLIPKPQKPSHTPKESSFNSFLFYSRTTSVYRKK